MFSSRRRNNTSKSNTDIIDVILTTSSIASKSYETQDKSEKREEGPKFQWFLIASVSSCDATEDFQKDIRVFGFFVEKISQIDGSIFIRNKTSKKIKYHIGGVLRNPSLYTNQKCSSHWVFSLKEKIGVFGYFFVSSFIRD